MVTRAEEDGGAAREQEGRRKGHGGEVNKEQKVSGGRVRRRRATRTTFWGRHRSDLVAGDEWVAMDYGGGHQRSGMRVCSRPTRLVARSPQMAAPPLFGRRSGRGVRERGGDSGGQYGTRGAPVVGARREGGGHGGAAPRGLRFV